MEKTFKKDKIKFQINETKKVDQYAKKFISDKSMFEIFKLIQSSIGEENSTMLESVVGPKADCNSTYIGVNPQFEIIIKDFKMFINSKKEGIKELFISNLQSIYSKENDCFNLLNIKFSDIFKVITATFILNKNHNEEAAINNGLIGYFGYEYLHSIEKIQRTNKDVLNLPDVHLKYFSTIVQRAVDSDEVLVVNNCLEDVDQSYIDKIISVVESSVDTKNELTITANEEDIEYAYNMTREDFLSKVDVAKKYILDGDIFQVQIGRRMHVKKNINPINLYEKLREINPSPYMFYWNSGDYNLISNSPELQLKVEGDHVLIRPIAGTSKGKGSNEEERKFLRDELVNNEKEQAEHIMLVDLARNDIGTVAIENTVNVSKLMVVEEFSNVFHLVSSVEGKITKEINTMELFENTFPAGTLTGAPKVRAMEIIEELEDEVRGPYGGAFGLFDFNGNIISSIIIRTVLRKGEDLYLQASAGIVADSVPENECNEIEHKTNTLKVALKGLI
ncbi:MAG: anthranilate synthase component I family protein [Clostridiaceae bacterium]